MEEKFSDKNFYQSVVTANVDLGISTWDVKKMLIWYSLLSYSLPFQIIFLIVYYIQCAFNSPFSLYFYTMLSVLFIILTDKIIVTSLQKDGKNYKKFYTKLPLVKLWAVPLIIMETVSTIILLGISFGIIG